MMWSASSRVLLRGLTPLLLVGSAAGAAWAAETQASAPATSTTQLVIKLATQEQLPIRTRFEQRPPTIVLEFPQDRVAGTLPERSLLRQGVVQEIRTVYASSAPSLEPRWIAALHVRLRGPYDYDVRTEPGRVVIDIEHPSSMASSDVQVGVAGGIVVSGVAAPVFSERFRAMQEALSRARPQPAWEATMSPLIVQPPSMRTAVAPAPHSDRARSSPAASSPRASSPRRPRAAAVWWWGLFGLAGTGLAALVWRRRRARPASKAAGPIIPIPLGMQIIDHLVWRAFERQGYQLVQEAESATEPVGLVRVIAKDGVRAALLCVGEGAFFEKAAVEQFLRILQRVAAAQGFLVAPGSFTVPAQRYAKDHGIALIGREQLTELLSEGAMNEYYTKRLQQLQAQVEEAKETLNQYAKQLDTLRRQRNEASWFLGEERAKSAQLEGQAAELTQQIAEWQAKAQEWQQAAEAGRKQWEESQWYLGESRASAAHLEQQWQTLHERYLHLEARQQEVASRLQEAERQRDEANWFLGEARAAKDRLEQQLATTQEALEELQRRFDAEQIHRQLLETELSSLRINGERRGAPRRSPADITVEWPRDGAETLVRGSLRDLSRTGFGFIAERPPMELPGSTAVRLYVPGRAQCIEATGRLIWQHPVSGASTYLGGCELTELSDESRQVIEQVLATPAK